jgi:ribosome maturation factor RimP
MADRLESDVEAEVERLGYELVDLERAGSRARPILRLRIDRPGEAAEQGITVEDCVLVSRALEASLDQRPDLSEKYVLEVSSPGVERPLVRPRDFSRFAGREIAVQATRPIHGNAKRVEGELIGLEQGADGERIRLRTANGEEIAIPRELASKVHLVFRFSS